MTVLKFKYFFMYNVKYCYYKFNSNALLLISLLHIDVLVKEKLN